MAARKPKIGYYWTGRVLRGPKGGLTRPLDPDGWRVNWRLVGANGETMCQSSQGHRDKTDARRAVSAVHAALVGMIGVDGFIQPREAGPGRKPK